MVLIDQADRQPELDALRHRCRGRERRERIGHVPVLVRQNPAGGIAHRVAAVGRHRDVRVFRYPQRFEAAFFHGARQPVARACVYSVLNVKTPMFMAIVLRDVGSQRDHILTVVRFLTMRVRCLRQLDRNMGQHGSRHKRTARDRLRRQSRPRIRLCERIGTRRCRRRHRGAHRRCGRRCGEGVERARSGRARGVVADVTSDAGRATLLAACPEPDILINNAGGPPPGDFRQWGRAEWIAALDSNMLSAIELIKATIDPMIARKFGRIVNITSHMVKEPTAMLGLSNGARAGLTGFVGGLARDVARHGVTVNNMLPGQFDTDRLRSNHEKFATRTGANARRVPRTHAQRSSGETLRQRRGVRRGMRVSVQRARRVHHRRQSAARRRAIPRLDVEESR